MNNKNLENSDLNISEKLKIISEKWEEQNISIKEILKKSKKTIFYFYPQDNTPGCTLEAQEFSSNLEKFRDLNIQVFWISRDDLNSHKVFQDSCSLKIALISDSDLKLHKYFWAWWEKNNYWKIVTWVIRSTFLLDENFNILKEWKNIRAKWHALRVLKFLEN